MNMTSALEQSSNPRKPKAKVWAATAGAGLGAWAGVAAAPDLAALTVDLAHLTLSPDGLNGLVTIWTMVLASAGSFGLGYVKK